LPSNNDIGRVETLYTLASTFEKKNSLSFRLLFGKSHITRSSLETNSIFTNAQEHLFLPGQIFGLEYQSTGQDFQKFHHILVLRSCGEGESGTIVPGVSPGAEVLIQALTKVAVLNLISVFKKIQLSGVCLSGVKSDKYKYLNQIISIKMRPDFFIGELIEEEKKL